MANEITALDRSKNGNLSVLFLFAIPSAIKVAGVVPTPSAGLPEEAGRIVTQPEKALLDSGDSVFRVVQIGLPNGESQSVTVQRLRDQYAAMSADLSATYRHRYKYTGTRLDK